MSQSEFNVSIVLFNSNKREIEELVKSLQPVSHSIFLIDNSPSPTQDYDALPAIYIHTGRNLGYGAAHNIALRKSIEQNVAYHLIINPDILVNSDIFPKIIHFMDNNSEIGHLMPKVYYPDGKIQYLCKLIPTPFDLIFRRFLPHQLTKRRMERFELRSTGYNRIIDVPYLSGCFMFLRISALKETGLFDERYFMYPEDIDLTRRIHRGFRTVFYPEVSIIHNHAKDSYKSFRMMCIHIINIVRYFNKWGWFFDKERKQINKKITKNL